MTLLFIFLCILALLISLYATVESQTQEQAKEALSIAGGALLAGITFYLIGALSVLKLLIGCAVAATTIMAITVLHRSLRYIFLMEWKKLPVSADADSSSSSSESSTQA